MPYALKHSGTGELLAARQLNRYRLPYYGLMLWEQPPSEQERFEALLRSERYPLDPAEDATGASGTPRGKARRDRLAAEWERVLELGRWRPEPLTEQEARLGNVLLRNDPSLRVYLREGRLVAERSPLS